MLFITYLAKGEIIVVGTIVFGLILILFKNWRFLYTFLISILGGELFVWIIKNIVDRPRPLLVDALVNESTYSFPSGHTFVAISFYGLLTYFILQSEKKKFLKIISFIVGLTLILWIGISRIYLGAHWPSDVFASLTVGTAWLTIIITSLKIKKKFHPLNIDPHFKKTTILTSSLLLIALWVIFIIAFYFTHPLPQKTITPITKTTINTKEIKTKLFENLPKISESIAAVPAEPIYIIVVEYYDSMNTGFAIDYDSKDEGAYKRLKRVSTTATDTWKEASFKINDAKFAASQNGGADFRIHAFDTSLCVKRVSVEIISN